MRLLPPFALAKRSDVRDVVATMPSVHPNHTVECQQSARRVPQAAGKILWLHGAKQHVPPLMKGVEQRERHLDRRITRVRKIRPEGFIERLYRWLILSQRKFEPDVGIQVAIREVVHNLPDRPAAGAIRRIELLLREAGDGATQGFRRGRDLSDCFGALSGCERRLRVIFSDRVTQIHDAPLYYG
jgi:hypothetical protein